jgi:serine protease Do
MWSNPETIRLNLHLEYMKRVAGVTLMMMPRLARLTMSSGLAALLIVAAAAFAADPEPTPKWDPSRATVPEGIDELKSLQSTVKAVVEKCTPATVAVLYSTDSSASAGSGVIVSEDGLVLTAAHVIRDYEKAKKGGLEGKALPFEAGKPVLIQLPDGKKVKGKTLGINAGMDSGMVQITDKPPDGGKWPFCPIEKSAGLAKGQWVVSLGHPNGPRDGRPPVARLGRIQSNNKTALRTDCTLVGGDSGGPLFDLRGNVIGIHSSIGPFTLAQNMHVPADQFKNDWDKMLAGEWVDKPAPKPVPAAFGVIFAENEEDDAWLREVIEGEPAEKAGLKPGDTITKFNDTVVKSVKQFRKLMEGQKPGDKVRITARRGIEILTFTVTLSKRA